MTPTRWTTEDVLDRAGARIRRLCAAMLGRDAEDGYQEVCLAIHGGLARFRGESAVETWAHSVALRTLGRWIERRRKARGVDDGHAVLDQAVVEGFAVDPFSTASQLELRRSVLEGIDRLPVHERACIALRYLDGMRYRQIADALEIPEGTVKSRLASATARLGTWLQQGCGPEDAQ